MAVTAAAGVPGSVVKGLLWKWYIGSAIDQNTSPMPMPAPNSMANQDR